jgi:hypothetical protein
VGGEGVGVGLMTFTAHDFAGTPAYASPESFVDPDGLSFSADVWCGGARTGMGR